MQDSKIWRLSHCDVTILIIEMKRSKNLRAKKYTSKQIAEAWEKMASGHEESIYAASDADYEKRLEDSSKYYVSEALILPTDDNVYLPFLRIGLKLEDQWDSDMVKEAIASGEPIFLFSTEPGFPEEIDRITDNDVAGLPGCFAAVTGLKDNEDGTYELSVVTGQQGSIINVVSTYPWLKANVALTPPVPIQARTHEEELRGNLLEETYSRTVNYLSEADAARLRENLATIGVDSVRRLNFMLQNSCIENRLVRTIFTILDLRERRERMLQEMTKGLEMFDMRQELHSRAISEIGQRQKDDFIRTQIRVLQDELNDGEDPEVAELRKKAQTKEWTEETAAAFDKEIKKLMRYAPNSPDYALQYSYLETFLGLPWSHCDRSEFELSDVKDVLEREHYGLDKVKKRIIEHMAVIKLRNDMKAPILCLYGPPGVGKTSLGKSIAEAMGRKYMRVALGGVHDEAEIRGHRRTYLGSMPGRIISALEKCGTSDPVIVLDEIDKMGADYKGDPSTALLEVLDPEQNCKFHDNYVDHDYDLSNVLFIATANDLSGVSAPLLDRMELIDVEGYVEDEKVEIAKRHLLPKNLKMHGFEEGEMTFTDDAIRLIIRDYTRESGVRRLEKQIAKVLRRQAILKADGKEFPKTVTVTEIKDYLGRPEVYPDEYENNETAGVVTGLAWTQSGGEILFIETSIAKGKDNRLTLTGNLGDVMKESASIALQYLRAHCEGFGIQPEVFDTAHVHIHVPEGAIPKDGPSAGITMLTSLASAFTKRRVRDYLAMTGELTLSGRVLPVGGIKEKILAAKRAGIRTVMLCEKNRRDIEEIPAAYIEGMEFHYVGSADEVLSFGLLDEPALR